MDSQKSNQPSGNLLNQPSHQQATDLDIHKTRQPPDIPTIHPAGCPENKPSSFDYNYFIFYKREQRFSFVLKKRNEPNQND